MGTFKKTKRDSPKSTAAKCALRVRVPTEIAETQFPQEMRRETSLRSDGSERQLGVDVSPAISCVLFSARTDPILCKCRKKRVGRLPLERRLGMEVTALRSSEYRRNPKP